MRDPEDILSAGLAEAKALGLTPVAVIPVGTGVKVDAPTVIRVADLLPPPDTRVDGKDAAHSTEKTVADTSVLVFPGSHSALERAIAEGRIPDTARALVFEGGQWLRAMPAVARSGEVGQEPCDRDGVQGGIDRWLARVLARLRTNLSVRRLQPTFDRREAGVLATLLDPGDYPFRLKRVVEGRVLLATSTLGAGGAERQLVNTAEGLRARGVRDVHILAEYLDRAPGQDFHLEKASAVAASVTGSPDHIYPPGPWALGRPRFRRVVADDLMSRIFNVGSVIKQLAPEVVQISLDWSNITVGMAAVLAGVPHVFMSGRNLSPTHFEFFNWFMYPCYRALARCPGVHFLNNSEAGGLDYARWLRLDPDDIRVLRNGLHADEFPVVSQAMRAAARKELALPADARVVVGAFRLSSEKRPLLWIDAAARLREKVPDCVFLLCGVGAMQREVEARVQRRGLTSHLRLLGSRADIATIFAAADVVMQSALQEGTPNVLLEAQAMGVPVVTPPAFGAAEAVDDGATGLVVREETAAGLAQAVVSILDDAGFAARARKAGPQFVDARFGFERMIDDTLIAYADAGIDWAERFLPDHCKYLVSIPLTDLQHESGQSWTCRLPQLSDWGDTAESPTRSPLIVLENGVPLGPPHATHETIRSKGEGAFSHWGDVLYFSSRDLTNPPENHRNYVAVIPRAGRRRYRWTARS